jgi:REP element-mobilizing transposase RayT
MQKIEKLEYGKYYHIYNRGINSCDIFNDAENFSFFLKLYDNYLSCIADTFAWVLLPNHFHFLIKIKEENEFINNVIISPDRVQNPVRAVGNPSLQFSMLFNSYARAFNKRNNRHGSLFERPFKRKMIDNETYLKQVLFYIHNNPVHHGFCEHPMDYPWSSYLSCISLKQTKLQRDIVIGWFDDLGNFKQNHNSKIDIINIEKILEL